MLYFIFYVFFLWRPKLFFLSTYTGIALKHTLKKPCHLKPWLRQNQRSFWAPKNIFRMLLKCYNFLFFLSNDSKVNFWRVKPQLGLYANSLLESILVTICTKDKLNKNFKRLFQICFRMINTTSGLAAIAVLKWRGLLMCVECLK